MTYTCLITTFPSNIKETIEYAKLNKFSAIAINSVNFGFKDRELLKEPLLSQHVPYSRSDLILTANDWAKRVVVMLSDTYGIDSKNQKVRQFKEALLSQELNHANFLQSAGYVMLRLNHGERLANLARVAMSKIKCILLINVRLSSKDEDDTWLWWNRLRTCANFSDKLRVVLEISSECKPSEEQIQRWISEPIEGIEIPSTCFIRNKNNYPVLPKSVQQLLGYLLENQTINFFVSAPFDDNGLRYYSEYLENLKMKFNKPADSLFTHIVDVCQTPLQPLHDNLDTYTYEVFEKDPLKYMKYQEAIEAALTDMTESEDKIVMVLGAGRGPLVRAVINASINSKRIVKIYVIEKNTSAINTLYAHLQETWQSSGIFIEVINQDMRDFHPPTKADMIVSELLGSFGDNELSPECLDCATRLLKPTGISIPYKSTSYVNPIMSIKLLDAIRNFSSPNTIDTFSYSRKAQAMYVVYMKSIFHIDEPKPLFSFMHPNRETPIDNSRFTEVSFRAKSDCILTGFAGYFDADLYKNIKISIHPISHTVGMSSWFPILIPLEQPQYVKAGENITALFWRNIGSHSVWYEWMTTSPSYSLRHNAEGISSKIYSV